MMAWVRYMILILKAHFRKKLLIETVFIHPFFQNSLKSWKKKVNKYLWRYSLSSLLVQKFAFMIINKLQKNCQID